MIKLLKFYWLQNKLNQFLKSIGFIGKNYSHVIRPEVIVLRQDQSEDSFVQVTTIETEVGVYITTIITKSGDSSVKEERKTESLEMAMLEHDVAVTRLIKKGLTKSDFKQPEVSVRPEFGKKNSYLYGASDFTPMLPRTAE